MARLSKILIANRGVCACRIMKTCKKMNIPFVTVFTADDRNSPHKKQSAESYVVESYMDMDEMIRVAKASSSDAIFPGYGFQSENPAFPKKCAEAGIVFVGPTSENMELLGNKVMSRQMGQLSEVNIESAPASGVVTDLNQALDWGETIGYPLLIKPADGGGGIGITLCENSEQLSANFSQIRTQCQRVFGSGDFFLEKFIPGARHIEVQVFGDGKGNVIHLGERECSVQRRFQKLIEESPSQAVTPALREKVCQMAVRLCASVAYKSAGTVEFVFSEDEQKFYFLEVNTRMQVEHRVSEMRYGVDLVEWMIKQASNETALDLRGIFVEAKGHAIECRLTSDDPLNALKPTTGVLTEVKLPQSGEDCQVDTWVYQGCTLSSSYDSLLATVVCWGLTREDAATEMTRTLDNTVINGPPNNLDFLRQFLATPPFRKGETYLNVLSHFVYKPRCVEVISPGLLTTVQDWPGRQGRGLWRVGVPPSGPMDHLSSRIANRLVGNQATDAVLEITQLGPTLKLHCDARIVLTGAVFNATLNGERLEMWREVPVHAGSILKIGQLNHGAGSRGYLAISGGIDVPLYLGSRSTFANGNFGGYQGRALRVGDKVPIGAERSRDRPEDANKQGIPQKSVSRENGSFCESIAGSEELRVFDAAPLLAVYQKKWSIGVLPGPHANPEYLTDKDMEMFYNAQWQVHHNSNRLGIRLSGPAPEWARPDGGEGGSHPSNIHDCEYAVGTINFTGNMPVIIAQDGPSLGGFVCPCTIVQSELWKIGQVKAGDTIEFRKMTIEEAVQARREQNELIRKLGWPAAKHTAVNGRPETYPETKPLLRVIPSSSEHPGAEIRLAGDSYILVEYGPMVLDLNLRFRVHFLEHVLWSGNTPGLEETAPGVRSLQIRYDPLVLPLVTLLDVVVNADGQLEDLSDKSIPTRVIRLPMCFNYSGVQEAIDAYMKSVRPHAPYLPSNITYIAQNNGLLGDEDVYQRVFSASYMCLGLGDVYLGACCAVPVNPFHRMVTSKYNPARTFTQEGTVGLGGSYMCIYPMDSPGGYQLVGRTLPIWDTFVQSNPKLFSVDKPWMLEMFDQIRFYPVTEPELDEMRLKFRHGELDFKVEEEVFNILEYNAFLASMTDELESYRETQRDASRIMLKKEAESLGKLALIGLPDTNNNSLPLLANDDVPVGSEGIYSPVTGKIWEVMVSISEEVHQGQVVATVEAMKMQCLCIAPDFGIVSRVAVEPGRLVTQGDLIMVIRGAAKKENLNSAPIRAAVYA